MTQPNEIYPGIVSDAQIMAGTLVIAGTRVPVSTVLGHLAAGDSLDTVADAYEITPVQLQAALGYAAEIIASEQVYAVAAGE